MALLSVAFGGTAFASYEGTSYDYIESDVYHNVNIVHNLIDSNSQALMDGAIGFYYNAVAYRSPGDGNWYETAVGTGQHQTNLIMTTNYQQQAAPYWELQIKPSVSGHYLSASGSFYKYN